MAHAAAVARLREHGVTVKMVTGDARADGGDMLWLDATTLAVGRSYRTNDEAIAAYHDGIGECSADVDATLAVAAEVFAHDCLTFVRIS